MAIASQADADVPASPDSKDALSAASPEATSGTEPMDLVPATSEATELALVEASPQSEAAVQQPPQLPAAALERPSQLPEAAAPEASPKEQPAPAPERRHYLVRALQLLVAAPSIQEAEDGLALQTQTADEATLRGNLAGPSRCLVEALADLRQSAVDRQVLEALITDNQLVQDDESDGESSADEFDIGESDGEDFTKASSSKAPRAKSSRPIVLPMGWMAKREARQSGQKRRVFVGPSGSVFSSQREARKAVDAFRRSSNMASSLKEQFAARLKERQSAAGASTGVAENDSKRQRIA